VGAAEAAAELVVSSHPTVPHPHPLYVVSAARP
jgi:hypothetical protein